jgi:hypothetical protein
MIAVLSKRIVLKTAVFVAVALLLEVLWTKATAIKANTSKVKIL